MKRFMGKSFFNNKVSSAVVVDVPSRYCNHRFGGLKGDLTICVIGEMKLDFEKADASWPPGFHQNCAIWLVIAVQIGNGQWVFES